MKVYKLLSKLANELLPLLFWILLLFGFDKAYMAIIALLCAILHEAGHFTAILLLKCDTGTPIGHISGFRIRSKGITSYRKSIPIFLAGPIANLLAALVLIPLSKVSDYFMVAALINFATAISNLLPIKGRDGYLALTEVLKSNGWDKGVSVLQTISFLLSVMATLLSLFMMYYLDGGYWFFGIFIVSVLSEMKQRLETAVLEN